MSGFEDDRTLDMGSTAPTATTSPELSDDERRISVAQANGLSQVELTEFVLEPSSWAMWMPDLAVGALSKHREKLPESSASPGDIWAKRHISTRVGSAIDAGIDKYVARRFRGNDQIEVAGIELLWSADLGGRYFEPEIHRQIQDARSRAKHNLPLGRDGTSAHSRMVTRLQRQARVEREK